MLEGKFSNDLDRYTEIEWENRILLEKMTLITTQKQSQTAQNFRAPVP